MPIIARCAPCQRLIFRKTACAACAAAERAIASAEASEARIRTALYPASEFVEVLEPVRASQPAPRAPAPQPSRPRVIAGRYELVERVGSGGSATVFRARDLVDNRYVALKVLHQTLSGDELAAARFRREARTGLTLRHPNIVRTFDHGVCDGTHYIVMEHVAGSSLRSLLAGGGTPTPSAAVNVVLQVLEATRCIHEHGIIHRDLTARNVIADGRGHVKVTDFGIACTRADGVRRDRAIIGTIEYMSPERLRREPASEASDVYSIGVMLYELLTGRFPFAGELVSTVAVKHLHECPTPPGRLNVAITPRLEAIVIRALAKAPEDRFQSAGAFAAELQAEAITPLARAPLAAAA